MLVSHCAKRGSAMIRNGLKIQVLKYLMAARLRDITNGWRTTAEITRDLGYRFQRGMFSALERYAKWGLIEKRKITLTEWRCTRKGQLRLLYLQRTWEAA